LNTVASLKFGSNIDLAQINPDIAKDYNQLEAYLEATNRDKESLYNTFNAQPPVESQPPSGSTNNIPSITDEDAESLDINNWVGGQ
jgi:hypothetical protein